MLLRGLLLLPRARRWMRDTIDAARPQSMSIAECGFDHLPGIFSRDLLARVRIVEVDQVPQPPLERWGLAGEALLARDAAGITLDQMIFVKSGLQHDESLAFHELVHAIQWSTLGINRFLALYGLVLLEHGYAEHPLEAMAYHLQAIFDEGSPLPNVEAVVARRTQEAFASFRARSLGHRLALSLLPSPRRRGAW